MAAIVRRLIPAAVRSRLKRAARVVVPFYYRLECPICGARERHFQPFGLVPRANARCPGCGALERHRLLWLYFRRRTDLLSGRPVRLLHFAPEPFLSARFAARPGLSYTTTDLYDPNVAVKADITALPFADGSFDAVLCSHVLEHIPDDRKAMRELRRVLRPGGYAVVMVPITVGMTVEGPSVTDPAERERLFGQRDHVRRYGPDLADRLREAGFAVDVLATADVAGAAAARFAIPGGQRIFVARPAGPGR